MPSTCRFDFSKPNATYFSGEVITGTITLNTSYHKTVRDVSIVFLGEGRVNLNEPHSSKNSHQEVYCSIHEVYVNNNTIVHGNGVLPAGTHTYSFNIPLPWECPTSCEGRYGHVRYEISLKLNRYYRFDNVYKMPVTIIKHFDLNLCPAYKLPLVLETISSSCCWPCSKGKIFCTLKIPFGGYAPGQTIKYALHIVNQTMDDTEGYFIEFSKKMIFKAKPPQRGERSSKDVLVTRSFNENCLRLANRIIEDEIYIPSTPPTTDISVIKVPIVIGTIPLRESIPANPPLMSVTQDHVVSTAPELAEAGDISVGGDFPPTNNEMQPPTFEEATRSDSPFINTDHPYGGK